MRTAIPTGASGSRPNAADQSLDRRLIDDLGLLRCRGLDPDLRTGMGGVLAQQVGMACHKRLLTNR